MILTRSGPGLDIMAGIFLIRMPACAGPGNINSSFSLGSPWHQGASTIAATPGRELYNLDIHAADF